jgi:hypothetical protein
MNCIDCDTTDINYIKRKNHTKCTLCSKPLCLEHAIRATKNGLYYRGANYYMCDQCCWWEIS